MAPRQVNAMAAVELLGADQAPLLLRDVYRDGDPGPIVGALAHVPELCEVALPFLAAALGSSSVPLRLKEIAILRTSARMLCRYCTEAHTVVAVDAGLGLEEVQALRGESDAAEVFSEPERTLIEWIDALAGPPGSIDDDLRSRLREQFADHTVVELTITIGATLMLNRLATGLSLPTSSGTFARLVDLGFAELDETPVTIGGGTW